MRYYVTSIAMYLSCICYSVTVMWSLCPYRASICGKEALFVAKAVHCRLGFILEMTCIQGEHLICYCLLQPCIIGIMVHLEVLMCLILCYGCWGSWPHVLRREVDDGH